MGWDEIVGHLRAHYRTGGALDGWIELWWGFADDQHAHEQHQTVRAADAFGEASIVIAAEVTAGDALDAEAALRHNATLAIGALAREGDLMVVRALIPARDLTPAHLDRALHAVAHEAARLSVALRPGHCPTLFAFYG